MKKVFILCLALIVSSILFSNTEIHACPKCNEDFKKELLDKRANTLGGQELLEAIKNQDGGNSVVLPLKYVTNDALSSNENKQVITNNNIEDNSISTFELVKLFFTTWFYYR